MQWNSNVFHVKPPQSSSEEEEVEQQPDPVFRDKYGKKITNELPNVELEALEEDNAVIEPSEEKTKKTQIMQAALRMHDPMYSQLKDYSSIPVYTKDFPENRFNIQPGYRWDGVDRSNGFEERYLETHTSNEKETSYFDDI